MVVVVVSARSLISVSCTLKETFSSVLVHSAKNAEMASSPSCVSLITVSEINWMLGNPVVLKSANGLAEGGGEEEVRSRRQRRKDTPHVNVSEVSEEELMMLNGCNGAKGPVDKSLNVPSASSLMDRFEKLKSSMYS